MAISEYLSFLMFVSNKISNIAQTLYCLSLFTDLSGIYTDNKKASPKARFVNIINTRLRQFCLVVG